VNLGHIFFLKSSTVICYNINKHTYLLTYYRYSNHSVIASKIITGIQTEAATDRYGAIDTLALGGLSHFVQWEGTPPSPPSLYKI